MTTSNQRMRAETTVTVQNSKATVYDDTASPTLKEISIVETFSGDIEGTSIVRALQILRADRTANMVSIQRVRGRVGDKRGTFVLQGSETIKDGKITASWFVVPGSGTESLTGLRGEGGFEGEFGKGSQGHLEYWFE